MSDISKMLLRTDHKGVHEQFDMLASAMQVQVFANSHPHSTTLPSMSGKDRERWTKQQLSQAMTRFGQNPGFFMRRLMLHVYQLYQQYYARLYQAGHIEPGKTIADVHTQVLPLAAAFLDAEFASRGVADVCLFLKQDPPPIFVSEPRHSGQRANVDEREIGRLQNLAGATFQIDLCNEIDRLFKDTSVVHDGAPKAVIIMGGVAAGKTHTRVKDYSVGYVVIDAAEMFHHMSPAGAELDFPDSLLEPLEIIGPLASQRAVSERRNVVTELIGADPAPVIELIEELKRAGYKVEVVGITCEPAEAVRRNENRGDNVSAYYAEEYQRRWLIDACRDYRSQ